VVYLQRYAEGWDERLGFVMKYDERPCLDSDRLYYHKEEGSDKWFFSFILNLFIIILNKCSMSFQEGPFFRFWPSCGRQGIPMPFDSGTVIDPR
jgi:hypothetical protein